MRDLIFQVVLRHSHTFPPDLSMLVLQPSLFKLCQLWDSQRSLFNMLSEQTRPYTFYKTSYTIGLLRKRSGDQTWLPGNTILYTLYNACDLIFLLCPLMYGAYGPTVKVAQIGQNI